MHDRRRCERIDDLVRHRHRRALVRDREQLFRELLGHADAPMRGGIAGIVPRVDRDPVPGQPQHVGHRRIVVEVRTVILVLFQDGELAGGRFVAIAAGRGRRDTDERAALKDEDALERQTDDDAHRKVARIRGVPHIIPGGERHGARIAEIRLDLVRLGRHCRQEKDDRAGRKASPSAYARHGFLETFC